MHFRLAYLEKRNLQLNTELTMMKEEAKKMHDIIYTQRYGQENQQDKPLWRSSFFFFFKKIQINKSQ